MTTTVNFNKKYNIVNENTPKYSPLKGIYKQSFAYKTLRERLPIILTGILDNLTKHKDEIILQYGEKAREEIKLIIGLLSKLKYQLQTDKTLEFFNGCEPDKNIWNNFLNDLSLDQRTFFKSSWLYSECYVYRKIYSFFENSDSLRTFDYFSKQKLNAMILGTEVMESVAQYTSNFKKSRETFFHLLKVNLWSNRFDLSLTAGKITGIDVKINGNLLELFNSFDNHILVDNSLDIWNCLHEAIKCDLVIEFVCDNAGYELFTDLLVADYLIAHNLATKVRFNVKAMPWFVSDVTVDDFYWTINYLKKHESTILSELGARWSKYLQRRKFELAPLDYFWTSPYEYHKMINISSDLYSRLTKAQLIIFKGDLNYRKLISDCAWNFTDKFEMCLRGFQPTNLCTLRTVKADLICGLKEGVAENLFKIDSDWMLTGDYALIQYAQGLPCDN